MNSDQLLDEIQDINLAYLMLAQRLLKEDRATAKLRLKLDDEMADLLISLSAKQLTRLARVNQFLVRLSFDSAQQFACLLEEKRQPELTQIHTAILMAAADDKEKPC